MMPINTDNRPTKIHFIGIGGTGMLAGANLAIEAGFEVRGSDGPLYPPASEMVKQLGVTVYTGFAEQNLAWKPDLIVVGNAFSRGHVEIEEMLRQHIPYTSLPEFLKHSVLQKRKPVVIAGTHGKTSTTALTSYLMFACGLDPGWLIGGQPLDLPASSRLGVEGKPFVIEGDEYDTAFFDKRAKFFHYLPTIAVVTSVEMDHGDIYDSIEDIERSFRFMLRLIPPDGTLLLCADDRRTLNLSKHAHSRVQSYGFSSDAHWKGTYTGMSGGFSGLVIERGGKRYAELAVPLAGKHNLQNSIAAVAATSLMGGTVPDITEALIKYKGVRRRMEVFLERDGVTYVDDFGHHPTAMKETISASRERWPGKRLRALIEPRSNTMVRQEHQKTLARALQAADEVYFGPIFRAERIPFDERLDRAAIVQELGEMGVNGEIFGEVTELAAHILESGKTGDVVLIFSNGSFEGIYDLFRQS
jgi:UDP-N-acetylmuramate: L-alanyl-gamma-D-glutamyl-meso-diaminopimelate ligase